MSGRFPIKDSKEFIIILKSLKGNTLTNNMESPIIKEAISNQASRPLGKGGRVKRKRTHVTIIAKEIKEKKKEDKKKEGKKKE